MSYSAIVHVLMLIALTLRGLWHARLRIHEPVHCSTAQVQAMHKLNQPAVIVKAREVDVNIVQGVLDGARSKFKQAYGGDSPSVTMAEDYLPGPPSGGNQTSASLVRS